MNDKERINFLKDASVACERNDAISPRLFAEYGVNLGLRDDRGKGVLTGLTNVSKITATSLDRGKRVPAEGRLWYRGKRIEDVIGDIGDDLGFERVAYLLLTGDSECSNGACKFSEYLSSSRELPPFFVRDIVMDTPQSDVMNGMTRSILALAAYDESCRDISVPAVLEQSVRLIAQMPMLAAYSYNAYNHYVKLGSMFIHRPDPTLSTSENLLRMLRPDASFSPLEAKVLDTALILHMEHGGGNNSTFTTRVVTSSGSDTYATIAAAMGSLKGRRHGGASIKTVEMMDYIKAAVSDWNDPEEIVSCLEGILSKDAFDRAGLIYGMGHAVYTLSDPRERIFSECVEKLAAEKGMLDELALYRTIELAAPALIEAKRGGGNPVCPNIDFYSGFVYEMLGIPRELFVPMFAVARIVGWSAHRLEELVTSSKIIRPAYMSITG